MRKILTLYCVIIVVLITACFPDKKVPPSSTVSSSGSSSGDITSGTLSTDSSLGESSSEESSSSSSTLLETFPTESSSPNEDMELIYQEIIPKKNTANLMNPQKGGADAEAEAMRQKVLNAADANLNITGQKYYVSPRGDDWNEGTSPEKAWKTGDAVMQYSYLLKSGDAVLFERGGVYRLSSAILAKSSITYAAYGKGAKPMIYGSPKNYAAGKLWEPSRKKNVWKLELPRSDAGIVVFNHGEAVGVKKLYGLLDLTKNLDFYHNVADSTLYLYLDKGYPNVVYNSIEIGTNNDIFTVPKNSQNVVLDNLCLKYTGSMCINVRPNNKGIVIKNCEMGWVGGSLFSAKRPDVRYGNAVQFWETTYDALVENNWIYQCYDTAVSPQGDLGATYKNFVIRKNLMEYNNWAIEVFDHQPNAVIDGIVIEDNIMRFSGYGWGDQRPNHTQKSHICLWNYVYDNLKNFYIRNNIFDCSEGNTVFWNWSDGRTYPGFSVSGNTFYQKANRTGHVMWYSGYGLKSANNQISYEAAVKDFDPNPKLIKWLL